MKKSINQFLTILFVVTFSTLSLQSQTIVTLDLSEKANDVVTQSISPGKNIEILLKNKLPGKDYEIIIERKTQEIDVINIPTDFPKIESMGGGVQMCASFLETLGKLYEIESEKKLPKAIEEVKKELILIRKELELRDTTEAGCLAYHVVKAEEVLSYTSQYLNSQALKTGENLEIIVKRKIGEDSVLTWKYIFSTPKRGKWLTSYGFSYIGQSFNKEELFYSKSIDTTFVITPENRSSKLRFAPSVFFTWMPEKDLSKNFSFNFTAGLGYDLEAPTVFLGGSAFYNQNISLVIGATAHKQKYLNGKYEPEQVLKENLSEAQLHKESYVINPFISLTFRFGDNPFKKEEKNSN